MDRKNIYFILVRPTFLGNIGATARALKNFGLANLRLVSPPRNYKEAEARKMAVASFDVLKNAEVFDTLPDALSDVALALGTTSGQQRDLAPAPIHALVDKFCSTAAANRVAIVFGDERNGLSREELQRCHHTITIPTAPDFPALNLAQAVAIAAYELNKHIEHYSAPAEPDATTYATGAHDDEIFAQIGILLNSAEFTRTFNRDKVLAELRSFYQRAQPTSREAALLKGALIKLNAAMSPH